MTLQIIGEHTNQQTREAARHFCLAMIKDVYQIDYKQDWHADLDSLLLPNNQSWFSAQNRGAFFIYFDGNDIIAAGGIYDLKRKPSTLNRLSKYYQPDIEICQIVRTYIKSTNRRHGIGRLIVKALETEANNFHYKQSYLHADAQAHDTLKFWRAVGYHEIGSFSYSYSSKTETCVDFDKVL